MDPAAYKQSLSRVLEHFRDELAKIHTGRPTTGLVEDISITYQGTQLPIKQVASVTVPDATSIVITPWDRSNLAAIETAIREGSTGLSPVNTGDVVRVSVPPLSEERRGEYMKLVDAKAEQAKVSLRTGRHEALARAKREWEASKVPEDQRRREEESLTKQLNEQASEVDRLSAAKKEELRQG